MIKKIIKANRLGLRQDEKVVVTAVDALTTAAGQSARSVLTSGYFNLTKQYESMLFRLGEKCRDVTVMVSSPRSNAWFNAKGFSQHVPNGYSWLEYRWFYSFVL